MASGDAAPFDTRDRVLERYGARAQQRRGEGQAHQEALTHRFEKIDPLRQRLDRLSSTGERKPTTAPGCCCLAEPRRGSARALP